MWPRRKWVTRMCCPLAPSLSPSLAPPLARPLPCDFDRLFYGTQPAGPRDPSHFARMTKSTVLGNCHLFSRTPAVIISACMLIPKANGDAIPLAASAYRRHRVLRRPAGPCPRGQLVQQCEAMPTAMPPPCGAGKGGGSARRGSCRWRRGQRRPERENMFSLPTDRRPLLVPSTAPPPSPQRPLLRADKMTVPPGRPPLHVSQLCFR